MKNALQSLLNNLDEIHADHGEIHDTTVYELLNSVIFDGFIEPKSDFELPTHYAMFSDEADAKIHIALLAFFNHPEVISAKVKLQTAKERLDAFQDESVQASDGTMLGDYFGYY